MADNWGFWTYAGKNGLKGVASTRETLPDGRVVIVKNPTNPAVLEDDWILHILSTVRQARADYMRLFPDLLPEEQDRLTTLIESNPARAALIRDTQAYNDMLQRVEVTSGIRVSARQGVS